MSLLAVSQKFVDDFFCRYSPFKKAFGDAGFSYLAVKLGGDFVLLRGRPRFEICWQSWPWPALQRASGRRRPDCLRPCLQAWPGRHCVEAQGFAPTVPAAPPDWLKMNNSDAPAVKREEEEEWGNKKRR
jgi:hypothetical protein